MDTIFRWRLESARRKQAEIEVLSLKLGDQVEAEWLTLLGLDLRSQKRPASLAVVDVEGARQIVKLRDPLALSTPRPEIAGLPQCR